MKTINRAGEGNVIHLFILVACFSLSAFLFFETAYGRTKAEDMPQIDPDFPVDITIDLEDESRFLGISLYKICDYRDGFYSYTEPYDQLDIRLYHKMSREADILDAAQVIAEFIEKEEIQPDVRMICQKGVLKAEHLSVGVYLVMQNDADFNASLDHIYVIEAPVWSDETEEYLYDIKSFPKWNREVWFSFRPEVVYPTASVIALCLSLALCIFGVNILRFVFFGGISILSGVLGMKFSEHINKSFISYMLFFVLFAFLGLAVVMMADMMFGPFMKKLKLHGIVQRNQFWIVPVIGAASFGLIAYFCFLHKLLICILIFAALCGLGITLQYLRKDKQVKFYTYDDLIAEEDKEETDAEGSEKEKVTDTEGSEKEKEEQGKEEKAEKESET